MSEDGRCDTEIRKHIGIAKDTFQKLGTVFKDRRLGSKTKVRVLDCYVNSVLLYGSECWTISAQMAKRLEATEMWFFRRMLRISWTDHVTNQEILQRVGRKKTLMMTLRRQLKFLGHVMRKEGMENLTLTGRIEGMRSRGRQRLTLMGSLSGWLGQYVNSEKVTVKELFRMTRDRWAWKSLIADVHCGYGT